MPHAASEETPEGFWDSLSDMGLPTARESQISNRRHCDMDVCEPVVSKCLHNFRCKCNFRTNTTCAKDCLDCLEEKFGKCCACVDLCPVKGTLKHSSYVGDLDESHYDELFNVLTTADDIYGRWTSEMGSPSKRFEHPEHGTVEMGFDKGNDLVVMHKEDEGEMPSNTIDQTKWASCKVAFINRQLDLSQCRRFCRSMGANSYRWFHETSCCECVGKSCIHYGIDKPKCKIEY